MTQPLLLSIITPTYNRADYIIDAVESVLAQNYANFEHIVIDGQSKDETLEILSRYPHLRVLSEPDRGMYDALNKGLKLAQGEVIGWVNSDDLYAPDAFLEVMTLFSANPQLQAVSGGALVFSGSKDNPTILRTIPWIETGEMLSRLTQNSPVTNGWFFRRSVFEIVGEFDSTCLYSGDRDFLLRMAFAGTSFLPLRKIVYHYRVHPGSYTLSSADSRDPVKASARVKVLLEQIRVLERFLSDTNTPPPALPYLRSRHSEQTYRLAATALYHRQWHTAKWAIFHGWKQNTIWPFFFIHMGLSRSFDQSRKNQPE
jgi:glycosyltransferase involved in cell wall biosynthesis